MAKQAWAPGSDLATLQRQKSNLSKKLKSRESRGLQSPTYQNKFKQVNRAIKGLGSQQAAPVATPPPVPTPAPTPQVNPTTDMGGNEESSLRNSMALFPSIRAMEPQNYMGSPLYDFQKKKGEEAINRVLAKRGLLNSGAEIQAISDFNTELGATEADKARGYAEKEADRLERIQQQEANRLMNRDDANFDRTYKWTDLMLRQNPMQYAMGGLDAYGNNISKEAKTEADYYNQLYQRAVGGGGGGGSKMPFIPPFPSGPDYSQIDSLAALGGGSSNNRFFNSILKGIGSIF